MSAPAVEDLLRGSHVRDTVCDWSDRSERESEIQRLVDAHIGGKIAPIEYPLCYFPFTLSLDREHAYASQLARAMEGGEGVVVSATSVNRARLPVRVGYLSSVFRSHSGGLSLAPMMRRHSSGFLPFGYSILGGERFAKVSSEIGDAFSSLETVAGLSPRGIAERIARDEIDILVDTERHVDILTAKVCALRPAPIQIAAWGYGGTTGLGCFDALLADSWMIREGEEKWYREKVYALPAYHPVVDEGHPVVCEAARPAELPPGAFVFANFGAHYKLTPRLFGAWMKVLAHVPQGVLYLASGAPESHANLRATATAHGIEAERVIFAPRVPAVEHQRRMGHVDLMLDNPHLGGGTSLADALSRGVPGISYDGDSMATRSGASVLASNQLSEYVLSSLEEYTEMAIALAQGGRCRAMGAALAERAPPKEGDFVAEVERIFSTLRARRSD